MLDFKFEGGRGIDSKTIDYARKINDEYPFAHEEFEDIGTPESDVNSDNANQDNCIKRKDIDGFLENMFDSRAFEMEFKKYFSFKTIIILSNQFIQLLQCSGLQMMLNYPAQMIKKTICFGSIAFSMRIILKM